MATGWDVASVEDAPLGSVVPLLPAADPWAVVKEEPIESAADRMKRHTATLAKAPSLAAAAKRTANLGLDIAGGLIGQVAGGVTGIGTDVAGLSDADSANLVHKAEGLTANQDPHSDVSALGHAIGETAPVQAIGAGLHAADTGLRSVAGDEFANAAERVAGHVVNAAPVIGKLAGPAVEAAGRLAGREPLKPLIPKDAPQVAIPAATAPDEVLRNAGYRTSPSTVANMTGAAGKPSAIAKVGEVAAGPGAAADNIVHNRVISNGWGATDIGLPRTAILTPENITKAAKPAADAYETVKGALPDKTPVSDATRGALDAAGQDGAIPGYELPPEVARSNANLGADPINADGLIKSIRALKQHGNKNLLSDDPVKNWQGRAQIDQATALQNELDSRVAAKVPAMLGAYQAARRLWAKIYTVQDALEGYNIDPQAIKKMTYKNEGIDGGLRIVADAATHAPDEVKLRVPPEAGLGAVAPTLGMGGAAVASAAYGHPVAAGVLASTAAIRPIARSILKRTRGETSAANLDKLANPDSSLGNYFGRNDEGFAPQPQSLALQPSPGPVIEPHQPSVLRSGESMPVRDTGGLPPPGGLSPPLGNAFEPYQPNLPLGDQMVPPEMVDFYHGGPHSVSKFDNGKIGTGEGNQSFSRGHYGAESPEAAQTYVPEKGGYLMHGQAPKKVVDSMLDWDKPIKDQPKILEALGVDPEAPVKLNGINPDWTGQELHDALVKGKTNVGIPLGAHMADAKEAVSQWLASKGIPGSKFLDQKSRKGGGTRNLVFFNPEDATILSQTKIEPKG